MKSPARKILRSTALVMILSAAAKATGLLREIIVAASFGTSEQMDAYLVAATIAGLMFVWFRAPIGLVLIPCFTDDLARRGERAAWENGGALLNSAMVLLLIVAALGWLLAPYLVAIVAPGFSAATKALSADLTRIMMLTVVFLGAAKLFSAFYHSYQRFGRPGMMGTVDNVVLIPAILLLTPVIGIHGLVVSAVLGTLAQALIQAPILWEKRDYYKARLDLKSPALRRMAWMSLPLLFASGGTKLDAVVDRIFASLLPPGSLSALSYGHRLTYAHYELFVTSLTTVLFPFFSKVAGTQGYDEFGKKFFRSLKTMFWIVFPISIGILMLHEPLVRLVFQRGAFTEDSVALTGQAVFFYAIGLSAYSLSHVLGFAFYSFRNTKTPVVMGLVRLAIKIAASVMLVRPMAHAGLALAESISFIAKTILLLAWLPSELKQREYFGLLHSFGSTAAITMAAGFLVFFLLPVFQNIFAAGAPAFSLSMVLAAALTVGAGAYVSFSFLIQRAEVKELYKFLRAGLAKS